MNDPMIDQTTEEKQQAIAVRPSTNLLLTPVMNLEVARQRLQDFQAFVKEYLVKDEDYGIIPGTPKPTLYKPGSDKLCELYGLADTYEITSRIEDWDRNLFDYEIRCTLLSKRDGGIVGTGMGSCNSYEGRYRWRDGQRKCPNCSKATIIKGKAEYGGGWLCFAKKGGCGAKFKDGDKSIEGQQTGRVENDDIPTLKNTILKMAKKRAKVDATLGVTRSSGIFTQDVEDFPSQVAEPNGNGHTDATLEEMAGDISKLMKLPVFTEEQRVSAQAFIDSSPTHEAVAKKLAQIKSFIAKASKEESKKAKSKVKTAPNPDSDVIEGEIGDALNQQEAF